MSSPIASFPAYVRNFYVDTTSLLSVDNRKQFALILKLASLYMPFRKAIHLGSSLIRTFNWGICFTVNRQNKISLSNQAYDFTHLVLATASVTFLFFNPTYSLISMSMGDLLQNARAFHFYNQRKDRELQMQTAASMTLNVLFCSALCVGSIELVVATLAIQVLLELRHSYQFYKNKEYALAAGTFLVAGLQARQMTPQVQLLMWKHTNNFTFEGTLQQDTAGKIFIEVSEEYARSLNEYFKPTSTNAPLAWRWRLENRRIYITDSNTPLDPADIGKTISFKISYLDFLKHGSINEWIVRIHSAAADAIRGKYNPNGQGDLHLSFGLQNTLDPHKFIVFCPPK